MGIKSNRNRNGKVPEGDREAVKQKEGQDLAQLPKVAEQGDARAQFNLGSTYAKGEGVLKDKTEAAKWYRKAVLWYWKAMLWYCVAVQQEEDQDIEQMPKAAEQLRKAADLGKGPVIEQLRRIAAPRIDPVGEDHDIEQLRKVAEQGDAQAQCGLGMRYAHGLGVPQAKQKAAKWYRRSAEQGLAPAQLMLGFMYAEGEGVPEDYEEAAKWGRKLVKQGFGVLGKFLVLLKEKQTPSKPRICSGQ